MRDVAPVSSTHVRDVVSRDMAAGRSGYRSFGQRVAVIARDGRWILGAVIGLLAFFVGETFDSNPLLPAWILWSAIVAVLGSRRDRGQLETSSDAQSLSSWLFNLFKMLGLVAVCGGLGYLAIQWRFVLRLSASSNAVALAVDAIGHASCLILGFLWMVWPRRGHSTMLVLGMIAVLMAVAGGGVSSTVTAQTVVGLATCIGFVLASQTISSGLLGARTDRLANSGDGGIPVLYALLALSLLLIGGSVVTQSVQWVLPGVQAEVFSQLRDRIEDSGNGGLFAGGRYVTGDKIGSVRRYMLADPNGLALRGYSNDSPGYLRGRAFDDYQRGKWKSRRAWVEPSQSGNRPMLVPSKRLKITGPATIVLKEPGDSNRNRFSMRQLADWDMPEGSAADRVPRLVSVLELHGQPEKGPMVFLPANTGWIESHGSDVLVNANRLVVRGVDIDEPYVAGVMRRGAEQSLTSRDRGIMSWVDPEILPIIKEAADPLCRGVTSSQQKARRIADYFQREYTYTLETESAPRGVDPIVHFLRTKHPAHCELFASATALMLRSQNVPTRYVTGYVMDELADTGDYYIARNRDAHAWVEFYDESDRRWYPAESTPGRTYMTLTDLIEQDMSTGGFDDAEAFGSGDTGALMAMWEWLTGRRITDSLRWVFQALQLPLLVVLVGWLWFHSRGVPGDPVQAELLRNRRKMDRHMRRLGWVRESSETLHQFANRLDEAVAPDRSQSNGNVSTEIDAQITAAATWYRGHARELYRGVTTENGRVPGVGAAVAG